MPRKGRPEDAQKSGWSEDELDEAEAGLRMFGTLMYTEEGEAKETKAYKKAQAAKAQNSDKPVWQQVPRAVRAFSCLLSDNSASYYARPFWGRASGEIGTFQRYAF